MSSPQTREIVRITAGFIQSEISTSLNSAMLVIFLMGIYTIVYFGSLYVYLSRGSQRRVVIAAITMLYLLCVGWFGTQWYILKWQFIDNGATRDTIFVAIYDSPPWIQLVVNVTTFIMYIIADGLLIWRCFYVWDRSFRVIALPLFLLLSETALYLATTILERIVLTKVPLTVQEVVTSNSLLSAGYFVSFATSLTATLLIAYRIYSVSKTGAGSTQRFKHIIEILIQTAAVYSLALLVNGISVSLPTTTAETTRGFALSSYSVSFLVPITGIAPTLMVARVALAVGSTGKASTTLHLSQLEFGRTSANHNDTVNMMNSIHIIDGDKDRSQQSEKDIP